MICENCKFFLPHGGTEYGDCKLGYALMPIDHECHIPGKRRWYEVFHIQPKLKTDPWVAHIKNLTLERIRKSTQDAVSEVLHERSNSSSSSV